MIMSKINKEYLIERAKIYREEAQRAIELFLSGDIYRAQLVKRTIIKSCCSELKNGQQETDAYYELLEKMAALPEGEDSLFENLDWIRVNCRVYIDSAKWS